MINTTPNWFIVQMTRDLSDGFVFEVMFKAVKDDNVIYGTIPLKRPDILIPFNDISENLAVRWVQQELGLNTVSLIESKLQEEVISEVPSLLPSNYTSFPALTEVPW